MEDGHTSPAIKECWAKSGTDPIRARWVHASERSVGSGSGDHILFPGSRPRAHRVIYLVSHWYRRYLKKYFLQKKNPAYEHDFPFLNVDRLSLYRSLSLSSSHKGRSRQGLFVLYCFCRILQFSSVFT